MDAGLDGVTVTTVVIAAGWVVAALTTFRFRQRRTAALCGLLAVLHLAVAVWPDLAPLAVAGWLAYGLAVPRGRLTATRTALVVAGTLALSGWTLMLAMSGQEVRPGTLAAAAVVAATVACAGAALRCAGAEPADRIAIQWLAGAAVLALAGGVVLLALHILLGSPASPGQWVVASLVLVPLAQALAAWPATARGSEVALTESIVVAGMAALVVSVYLVVVVGLNRAPVGGERDILLNSIAAAIVVAVFALPVRHRLVGFATALVGRSQGSAEEVVATFGARMSRAVPMDELMLQLAESLRATVADRAAEIWVGNDGVLTRTVSVPTLGAARIELGEQERVVVGRARIGGASWCSVWIPALVEAGHLRVAPVAHLGHLLGLIVVRRDADAPDFTEDEDRLLVDLARQLGLALHNVRLDSALQASLAELEQRNAELQASRLRIVTASDESRRAIERNLHDGAQQHLVALAVKLGLARQIVEEDPETVLQLLEQLREDVRVTIAELRELAHGIYPPLLRDRGLGEALRTAGLRCPLACSVEVDLPGRYPEEVETAAYFCCLEAIQNAGKHAGAGATVTVTVGRDASTLWFAVRDDGLGFDPAVATGHGGFVNMQDRLGAIGGQLSVESAPGQGTTVRGSIPAQPREAGLSPRAWSAAAGA
jgi:signal transduction histidine kinase